jgi:hypothetical protein
VHYKDAGDSDVSLYDRAPLRFTVSAVLQREDSYLWIGIHGDPNEPLAIIKGDALRALVTDFLKHFNAPLFTDGGAR